MIITKTPYRISFFGGGTDYPNWYNYYPGKVISTTINKGVYISCRSLPNFFKKHKFRICYSKNEEVLNINQIKHKVFREILKYLKINTGLEIHYDGELPARSGMGSSSSVVVGLLKALYFLKNQDIDKKKLAKKSIFFEQKILKETVGIQDQIAAAYGGFNIIKFDKKKFTVSSLKKRENFLKNLENSLLLVYTGITRDAQIIASLYANNLRYQYKDNIKNLIEITNEAENILYNGISDDFGRLLNESWILKKSLSNKVSNNKINQIYDFFIKNGALGGKILGAGGGGFMLFFIKPSIKKKILKKLKNLVVVPFKFDDCGSKIISS
ncbi:hypothetical protein OAT00_01480 [Pelagibacteraceae bacterium]|nr:hypothetical protein [Pelagibacteraceae bacterium]